MMGRRGAKRRCESPFFFSSLLLMMMVGDNGDPGFVDMGILKSSSAFL